MVRIGILGTAGIARLFFGGDLRHAQFVAIASRDALRARVFAREFGLTRAYSSYEELLADSHVDAVYLPLPPHLHRTWAVNAARAGKHVLVEKPGATSAKEFEEMLAASREAGVLLMEAMMYRFKQIHIHVRLLLEQGVIGPVRHIDFSWSSPLKHIVRSSFRTQAGRGGGALNDLGIYGADFLHQILGPSVHVVHARVMETNAEGVDLFTHALCTSPEATASLTCGFTVDANYYVVCGEEGLIHVPGSVSGRLVENRILLHQVRADSWREEVFPPENPYHLLVDHFAACIEEKKEPLVDPEETLRNLRLLDEIRRQSSAGQ